MLIEHIGAIFIIILSYIIPYFFSFIRNDKYLLVALYLVISAHQLVSLFNYYIYVLPGAGWDANTFSNSVIRSIESGNAPLFSVGTGFYEYILYVFYYMFGANKLVGQSLSILVTVFSCIFILRIADNLKIKRSLLPVVILIAGFTPSFLFYTSLTFREAFQLLGLAGGIYFAYEAFSQRSRASLLYSSAFYLFMGFFHHVLLGLSFVLILINTTFYMINSGTSKKTIFKKASISLIIIMAVGYSMVVYIPAGKGNDYIKMLSDSGGIIKMIDRYRAVVEEEKPRSTYGFKVDTSSLISTGYGLSISYVHYLFGPGVTSISKAMDYVAFINALGRLIVFIILLYIVINRIRLPVGMGYLLIVYFSITMMWSIGTTNYGQAFRHNSLTDWILAIILVIGIQEIINLKTRSMTRT